MRDNKVINLSGFEQTHSALELERALRAEFGRQVELRLVRGSEYAIHAAEPALQVPAYWFCVGFITSLPTKD